MAKSGVVWSSGQISADAFDEDAAGAWRAALLDDLPRIDWDTQTQHRVCEDGNPSEGGGAWQKLQTTSRELFAMTWGDKCRPFHADDVDLWISRVNDFATDMASKILSLDETTPHWTLEAGNATGPALQPVKNENGPGWLHPSAVALVEGIEVALVDDMKVRDLEQAVKEKIRAEREKHGLTNNPHERWLNLLPDDPTAYELRLFKYPRKYPLRSLKRNRRIDKYLDPEQGNPSWGREDVDVMKEAQREDNSATSTFYPGDAGQFQFSIVQAAKGSEQYKRGTATACGRMVYRKCGVQYKNSSRGVDSGSGKVDYSELDSDAEESDSDPIFRHRDDWRWPGEWRPV
eukprot:g7762.t1